MSLAKAALKYLGVRPKNPPDVVQNANRAPTSADTQYILGTLWPYNGEIWGFDGSNWVLFGSSGSFPITPFVVGPAGEAGYQTIQSALNAAASSTAGALIYVMPGSYTENLTFPDVPITLMGDRGLNTTITGVHVPSATADLELHQILLISATHILSSSAAGNTSIEISECFILVTNGFVFNLVNWTGTFLMDDCGEASTNDGVVNNTAGVTIKFLNTEMGAGTGQTMTLTGNGNVRFDTCNINCPVNIAGSGTFLTQNGVVFRGSVTLGGSKTGTVVQTAFLTGATTALTFSSSGATYLSDVTVNSSANPAIAGAGAGVLTLAGVDFVSNALLAGTLTVAYGSISGVLATKNTAGASPQIVNARTGQVGFTDTIANGAFATLTLTNSTISSTSVIVCTASCATVASGVQVVGIVPGSGTVALRLFNAGSASTATTIFVNFWVVN